MLFSSSSESNEQNADFADQLRAWLISKDIDTQHASGIILLVLLPDGFDVLQLGHEPVSDAELALYVQAIARSMQESLARQN